MIDRLVLCALLALPITCLAQWTQQSPLPTGLGVSGLAAISDSDVFVATSSSMWDGAGRRALLETRDGGFTWVHRMVPENDDEPLHGIQFLDAQHGWAFGNFSYRTIDGGVTWQALPFLGTTWAMEFYTPTFGRAVGNFGFAITHDGGLTWTLDPPGPRSFAFANNDVGIGISGGQIFRTVDGGHTFTPVHSQGGPDVTYLTDDKAVAIAGGEFVFSGDGGQTWSAAAGAQNRNRLVAVSPSVVLAWRQTDTVPNGDGRVLRSADGGGTWTDLGIVFGRGTGGFAVLDDQTVVAVDEAGDVFRSADAGLTWTPVFDAPFTGHGAKHLSFSDALHGWLGFGYGALYATRDGGLTWSQASNGYGHDIEAMAMISPQRLVAVGLDGGIVLTEDGGLTWELVDDGIEEAHDLVDVHVVDDEWVVSITQLGLVVRSEDGGRSWQPVGVRPDPGFEFRAYAVHFRSRDEGWVAGTRYQFPALYHTLDGGQSWTARPYPGLWVALDFQGDRGWVLDNRGPLLRTVDGGNTWIASMLPPHPIPNFELELTDIKFFDEYTGYVTGWGGYLAKTTDGGASWAVVNVGSFEHQLWSIALLSADEIWIATTNDRVYHSVNGGQSWQVFTVESAPLSFGSFTSIVADPEGNVWVGGFKGHIYSRFSEPVSNEPVAGAAPAGLSLSGPYPNPASSSARLTLQLGVGQHVVVEVFDALGRRLRVLYEGRLEPSAGHELTLDTSSLPSGLYVVRARGEVGVASAKIAIARN